MSDLINAQELPSIEEGKAICLYQADEHSIYWLGVTEESAFRCNSYLIVDGDEALLVDPGNRSSFPAIKQQISTIIAPANLTGIVVCHQDPDVAASLKDWLEFKPELTIFASPRTMVLLPHYGIADYATCDIEETSEYTLPFGNTLQFITAPFLHSPMAFTTFDTASGFLMSGDIFAAIDTDWRLVVEDFDYHSGKMDLFHIDYMASNIAARGFTRKLDGLEIKAMLPQHGSIIPEKFVPDAIAYLNELQCGTDVLYPDLF